MLIRHMTSAQKTLLGKVRALLDTGLVLDDAIEAAKAFGSSDEDADAVRHTIVNGNRRA